MKKIVLLSSLLLCSCGTLFSGSSQTITFDSNVKGPIQIYADGALVCNKTPCVVDIDRHSGPMSITAKAKGYEDFIAQNKTRINTVSWLNLFGLYSWTTDFATSSMWKYSQDGIYINMEKSNMKVSEAVKFKKETQIRRFALYNYSELKIGNNEYIEALKELTNKTADELTTIIAQSKTEVELAENLASI
ncbi:MAG: hypothetical protein Q4D11_02780 [Rhodospirillales bacterium]|nr:hypothetical protein [Rhodospirillales bacterium]